jgi:hypothetical protein
MTEMWKMDQMTETQMINPKRKRPVERQRSLRWRFDGQHCCVVIPLTMRDTLKDWDSSSEEKRQVKTGSVKLTEQLVESVLKLTTGTKE